MSRFLRATLLTLAAAACGTAGGVESAWMGAIDTLESGTVVVTNPEAGVWDDATCWHVVEDLRIGRLEGDGPDLFGGIRDLALDAAGRIWVLEGQAQEIRVFDADGQYVRTIGRKGGGPGEFANVAKLEAAPNGTFWAVDPQNNRVSVFDTSGAYVEGKRTPGGFLIFPWPGRFDREGYYYSPVPVRDGERFTWDLVRHDTALNALDSIRPPQYTGERRFFELSNENGSMMAGVPYMPTLRWRLAADGTIWALLTGEYKLFQLTRGGDTLRVVSRPVSPLPVTDADMDRAMERLEWFRSQGGKVDASRIPDTRPPTQDFFLDEAGDIWVVAALEDVDREGRVMDVFDPVGRYLGRLELPWSVEPSQTHFRGDTLYTVAEDELEVPYVVRAIVRKP